MAHIVPHNSARKALLTPRFSATLRIQFVSQFLNIIPQADHREDVETSVFPLIQL